MPPRPASVTVPDPIVAGAIETRAGWSVAFAGDQATSTAWPSIAAFGALTLTPSGTFDLAQKTGVSALGVGSARIDQAVVGDTTAAFTAAGHPALSTFVAVRLIAKPAAALGELFRLTEAAQTLIIRRTAAGVLEVETTLPATQIATANLEAFTDYVLIDVDADLGADTVTIRVNGVAFPVHSGARANFGGAPALTITAVKNTEILFVGTRTASAGLTAHRADANLCATLADGIACVPDDDAAAGAVGTGALSFEWAWSAARYAAAAVTLDAEPEAGGDAAPLSLVGSLAMARPTAQLRPEGLGRPRLDHSVRPLTTATRLARTGSFLAVTGDFHMRLIARPFTGIGTRTLFAVEFDATRRLAIGVIDDDLTVLLTSGYAMTFANVLSLDDYALIDVSCDRDGAGGNAQARVYLNGVDLAAPAHASTIPDLPAGAGASIFDGVVVATATAADMDFVFAGIELGRVLTLARHQLDAYALEVP